MPTRESMTWVPRTRQWTRMHKGKRFWVSCRQLGITPQTKEASVQAANAWWKQKEAEIESAGLPVPRAPLPLEDVARASLASKGIDLLALARIIEWDFVNGRLRKLAPQLPPEVRAATLELFISADEPDPEFIEQVVRSEVEPLLGSLAANGDTLGDGIAAQLPPARANQISDAVKAMRGESSTPTERTVKANVDRWVATQQARAAAGSLAPDRADINRICLTHFAGFLGETADVNTIDAARLHDFYLWCLQKVETRHKDENHKAGWSVEYAKKVFDTARIFVRFLGEGGLIELPRNVNSKKFRFNGGAKAVQTWTVKEVQRVISEAPGQLKLHLLLMANCGYTQADISDLIDEEVDWRAGRIIRKRSKTSDKDSTPTVNYKLWPVTFQLLKQYRSGAERVLLTESGKPFVRKELVDGKLIKADGIASNYAHLKRRLKFRKPLKQLRKTSASMLESHRVYGRFVTHFLGHSPRSIKDRNYAAPPQKLFEEAVLWLGKQLGQC